MRLWRWAPKRPRLLASFAAITIVPVTVLGWLTWRIIDQDRALERQTLRDRSERTADLTVATLDRALTQMRDELVRPAAEDGLPRTDALVVSFAADSIAVRHPGRLVYFPGPTPPEIEPPRDIFGAGETLEFRDADLAGAIGEFRKLSRSPEPGIRGAALVRLARNYRKAHRLDDALATYTELARLTQVNVGGIPADLLGRDARCALLAESSSHAMLEREARELIADLARGRWRLDRASYIYHIDRARRWVGPTVPATGARDTSMALAGAVEHLWSQWQQERATDTILAGHQSRVIDGLPVLLVWQASRDTLHGLVAGPGLVVERLRRSLGDQLTSVSLTDAAGYPVFGQPVSARSQFAIRSAEDSRLPWTVRVASVSSVAEASELAGRRRLLLAALALTALLTIAGGYFTARATGREIAVAKLESDFVSAVSHEFRTPLTSLRHLTELLASGGVSTEERRQQYYAVMAHETARLHRMVEGLLEFGQMEAGRRAYSFEPVNAVALVDGIVEDFRADVAPMGRAVETAVLGLVTQRHVHVDREAMGHAIRNLLENAVKYSADGSPVHVELATVGEQIAIGIRDEGIGIGDAERDAIFEKFVRGSASRAMHVKGTGIGLTMARQIVHAHGGTITVESAPSRGSTFTVLLPSDGSHEQSGDRRNLSETASA